MKRPAKEGRWTYIRRYWEGEEAVSGLGFRERKGGVGRRGGKSATKKTIHLGLDFGHYGLDTLGEGWARYSGTKKLKRN